MDNTDYVRSKYDQIASRYDLLELFSELAFFKRWRKTAISKLKEGKVLEIGAGTGKNFPYYDDRFEVLAIDFSPGMMAKASERAAKLYSPPELKLMDAQQMDLPADAFDSSLATFVFCSVPDPITALKELRRVLKADGRAVFLEHVRPRGFLGPLFDWGNRFSYRFTGVNINRETTENIRRAGFNIVEDKNLFCDIFKLIVATPA